MTTPSVPVVVPVVQSVVHARCPCIDSILDQTLGDFELLLVDDGSPDACPQICDEYCRSMVETIHQMIAQSQAR